MTSMSKIPATAHWAILTEQTVITPGDERSRTHPGHGYSEHTDTYINYEAFDNEKGRRLRVVSMTQLKIPFRAIKAIPARVSIKVEVD